MAKQITRSEFEKLQKELAYLKKEGREDIAQKLEEARSHGDLSENAEYDEARNDQARLEENIAQLELELDTVEVVDDNFFEQGVVHIGSLVTLDDNGEIMKCFIGSSTDLEDTIAVSDDSPVGSALLGKKAGDIIDVTVPSGAVISMKVISTEYNKEN
ncbi:MAG: transcription elongation factor GreA [Clostridia bacterium]|nr:transcription elongation factor GreA [Clostridia bacterium]